VARVAVMLISHLAEVGRPDSPVGGHHASWQSQGGGMYPLDEPGARSRLLIHADDAAVLELEDLLGRVSCGQVRGQLFHEGEVAHEHEIGADVELAVPPAIAIGEWSHRRVAERPFRLAVFALLLVAGGTLVV